MMRLLKLQILIALGIAVVLAFGCAASSRSAMPSIAPSPPPIMGAPAAPSPNMGASKSAVMPYAQDSSTGNGATEASPDDRRIVRTGSITLEVADVGKSVGEITAIANQLDGYVVSSNQSGDEDNPRGYVSIRVPSGKFDDALQKLKAIASKVVLESTSSQDVTEQYSDLQSQLKNYEATEAQYLELLKKAESVEDILKVQQALSNIRGTIERTKGRILYLERTSDMSLVEITVQKSRPIGSGTWDVPGIFKTAVDGLIGFGKVLLAILIWVVVFIPLWIIIFVIIFLVRRSRRKRAAMAKPK
jgi:hypothetical protein